MDLWIRSQDRKSIVKPIDILLENPLNSGETGIRGYFSNNSYKMLGYYQTEQRALEVLDEIQNAILGILSLEDIEEQKIKQYTGFACLSKVTNCLVYEMPKE